MKVARIFNNSQILQDTFQRLHYSESTLKVTIFKEEILDSREEVKFCENFLCLISDFKGQVMPIVNITIAFKIRKCSYQQMTSKYNTQLTNSPIIHIYQKAIKQKIKL